MKPSRAIVMLAAIATMGLAPRRAPAPPHVEETAAPPNVAAEIADLGVASPRRALSKLDFAGTNIFKGDSRPYQRDLLLRSGDAPGMVRIEERSAPGEDDDFAVSLSFMGLVTITQDHWFKAVHGVVYATRVSDVSFSGDWATMKVGKTIGFKTRGTFTDNSQKTTHESDWDETCKIKSKFPASRLFETLEGSAKKLKCTSTNGDIVYVTDEYLLEDYGFFVELKKYPNDFYSSEDHLTGVQ